MSDGASEPSAPPAPGDAAPALRLTLAGGETRGLEELLQGSRSRSLLLAFFKTTCPTCTLVWPYLARLHEALGDAIRVVGVSQDPPDESRRFHEEARASFELAFDPGPGFPASNEVGLEAVPYHLWIGADGRVRATWAGWSRQRMNDLASEVAVGAGRTPLPLVGPDDPVPSWKAG